jgi:hypothetical protein
MIIKKKPDVDVIMDVLNQTIKAQPSSDFLQSLLFQYQERGGLSKKQLEGLHAKAAKVPTIGAGKLATLQAIILKKPTRYKSPLPVAVAPPKQDIATGEMIAAILAKYPQHKRVLFYKTKYDKNDTLSVSEKAEVERFAKLLLK